MAMKKQLNFESGDVLNLRMQTNNLLFEYSNTEYYLNSKFDIRLFVCFNKYAYRA